MEENLYHILRLLMAGILGALIGMERDMHGRSAGLRTHMIVSLGSCLFTICSMHLNDALGVGGKPGDTCRIAAQIVSGIGFLGAGTIMKEGGSVKGLTTAACLWIAASVGMSVAIDLYLVACVQTGIVLLSIVSLKILERHLMRTLQLKIRVKTATLEDMDTMQTFFQSLPEVRIAAIHTAVDNSANIVDATVTLSLNTNKEQSVVTSDLANLLNHKKELLQAFSISCEG